MNDPKPFESTSEIRCPKCGGMNDPEIQPHGRELGFLLRPLRALVQDPGILHLCFSGVDWGPGWVRSWISRTRFTT